MLGSLGDGSRELQVELLSERYGFVVQMLVDFELRLLLHAHTQHTSTTTTTKKNKDTNVAHKQIKKIVLG